MINKKNPCSPLVRYIAVRPVSCWGR